MSNLIKIGNTDIDKVCLGSDEIDKIYLGNDIIYESAPSQTKYVWDLTTIGTDVIINDGIVSNFSGDSYLKTKHTAYGNVSLEINLEFSTTTLPASINTTILGKANNYNQPYVYIGRSTNPILYTQLVDSSGYPYNGKSWGQVISPNTNYILNINYIASNGNYRVILTNKDTGVVLVDGTQSCTSAPRWTEYMCIGNTGYGTSNGVSINLNNSYIKKNGDLFADITIQ